MSHFVSKWSWIQWFSSDSVSVRTPRNSSKTKHKRVQPKLRKLKQNQANVYPFFQKTSSNLYLRIKKSSSKTEALTNPVEFRQERVSTKAAKPRKNSTFWNEKTELFNFLFVQKLDKRQEEEEEEEEAQTTRTNQTWAFFTIDSFFLAVLWIYKLFCFLFFVFLKEISKMTWTKKKSSSVNVTQRSMDSVQKKTRTLREFFLFGLGTFFFNEEWV